VALRESCGFQIAWQSDIAFQGEFTGGTVVYNPQGNKTVALRLIALV